MTFKFTSVWQGQSSSDDNPAQGQSSITNSTPLGRAVDELAIALGLHPVTSPDLAQALHHFVSVVHPTVGKGGLLLFDLVAVISRAVLDKSVEGFGQVNSEAVAVIGGGSPVRLLNFYRTKLPNQQFNPGVTLEGAKQGGTAEQNDAFWLAKNEQFEKQHLVARNFCSDASITVLAVMRAIPAGLLGDVSEERVKEIGDEVAAGLNAQGYPVSLLTHSEARRLVAERRGAASAWGKTVGGMVAGAEMISFPCPSCKKTLKAPPEKAGAKAACPACRHTFVVPPPEKPVLDVLPVEEEAASKKIPPPLPPVAPSVAKLSPRPEPQLKVCKGWQEVAAILATEDESERSVEVAGLALDEVRRRLDRYAATVPHHRVGNFGSRASVLSLTECCLYSISIKVICETRRLGQGEAPYLGGKIPPREFTTCGLDLWDFRFPCRIDVSGRSEHVITASQKTHTCDQCSGRGFLACAPCRGWKVVTCQKCRGSGTEACGRCGGVGHVTMQAGMQ